ncbi:MAG: lysostaphin resistance A-like protein [Planctomycetota bacterium]|jgi:membrane protease YdiL (CAAX protease family)
MQSGRPYGDHFQAPGAEPRPAAPPAPRGWALGAWLVIIAAIVLTMILHAVGSPSPGTNDEDPVGLTVMQLQAKSMVGMARSSFLPMDGPTVYEKIRFVLNTGTVGQRQRSIIVAAELAGAGTARDELEALGVLIAGEQVKLSEAQASVQRILHDLYPKTAEGDAGEAAVRAAEALGPTDRALLVDELGWFGELAMAPSGSRDAAAREAALRPARIAAAIIVAVEVLGVLALSAGFIGLVLAVVFTLTGRLRSNFGSAQPWHAIYAETFAVWLVLFLGMQAQARWIATPSTEMPVTVVMFFASLIALAWPVIRGVPWAQVRRDIGWTLGRLPWAEPFIGLGAYVMTLPLLAVGLAVTLFLMFIQGVAAGEQPVFGPTGGPAHPIIVDMAGTAVWPKIFLLFLAAVAAPIVEETMFRGVLYRHLRDASAGLGIAVSVVLSVVINTFIFAVIHPQGLVAVPALMSLACGMALVREWRGTLIPSMVVHGVSNGLIMGTLLIVLSV